MNVGLIGAKFVTVMRRDGPWKALRLAFSYVKRRPERFGKAPTRDLEGFDGSRGTDTDEWVYLWNLQVDSPNARFGVRYQPSDEQVLGQAVNFLGEDPERLTFIDLGCGKGRMLILAWEMGFRRIVGVEFASELVRVAEANLRKVGALNASVINADAAHFQFPDEDLVLYLFNPFSKEVMQEVVENLRRVRSARKFVIYKSPSCAELFDSSGFLGRVGYVPEAQNATIVWASRQA